MTDNELKALVAGLAVAQDRTEAVLAETAVRQAKHEAKHEAKQSRTEDNLAKTEALLAETAALQAKREAKHEAKQSRTEDNLAKTEALLAETAALQAKREAKHEDNLAKTEALLAETAALQAKTAALQAKTEANLAKTEAVMAENAAEIKRLAKMYGGVGNNLGAVAEEFYHNSLKAEPVLAGVRFDSVDKNITRSRAGLEDEFDLLLANGREVFVVEVKHKAHENDLKRLLDEKAPNFRRLFPEHAGRRQRFALAAFHIHDKLKEAALAQGVTVLQRKGDVFDTLPV